MIARRTLIPIGNTVVGAILGLIALKVVAVYFGRESYGQFEAALAFLGIFYLFADLNMGDAHVKRVSEGENVGDCFATFAAFRFATSILFILVASGSLLVYTVVLGQTVQDTTTYALLFAMLYYVGKAAQGVAQSTFDARLEAARSQLGSFIETLVRVLLTLGAAVVFTSIVHKSGRLAGKLDASNPVWRWIVENPSGALAFAYAAGSISAAIVGFYYLVRTLERGRFRMDLLKSYLAFALPLFAASSVALVALYIDRVMLAFFGTSIDTADFAGPRRIVTVFEGLGMAVSLLLFPAISAMSARNEHGEIARVVDKGMRYLSLLLAPIVAFLVVFPQPVVRLALGEEWVGEAYVLSVLAVWSYFHVLGRPMVNLILGSGRVAAAARIGLTASLVNIVLNTLLIPDDIKSLGIRLGGLKAMGAAIATLISGILSLVMLTYAARKIGDYRPKSGAVKHILASGLMVGFLWLVDRGTPLHLGRWYSLIIYAGIGAVAYAFALILLREISKEDVQYVRDVLNPGEMWRYLRSELLRK